MQFDVRKRLWLGLFLPASAKSLADYRILHELKLALSFAEDERKTLNLRDQNDQIRWDFEPEPKEIEIGDRARAIIVEALKEAAVRGPINDENIALFEAFDVEG